MHGMNRYILNDHDKEVLTKMQNEIENFNNTTLLYMFDPIISGQTVAEINAIIVDFSETPNIENKLIKDIEKSQNNELILTKENQNEEKNEIILESVKKNKFIDYVIQYLIFIKFKIWPIMHNIIF